MGRDHRANVVLHLLEIDFGLLDACARRTSDVQPELSRVDSREEVAADERIQKERRDGESEKSCQSDGSMFQSPLISPLICVSGVEAYHLVTTLLSVQI